MTGTSVLTKNDISRNGTEIVRNKTMTIVCAAEEPGMCIYFYYLTSTIARLFLIFYNYSEKIKINKNYMFQNLGTQLTLFFMRPFYHLSYTLSCNEWRY